MAFLTAILVATVAIVSCEVTQMVELTPAKSTLRCDVSLWCQDHETAEKCDKVSYCNRWIWIQEPLDAVSAVTCENCTKVVELLLKHEDDIINIVCSGLPIFKLKCQEFFDHLLDNLNATVVCTKLDFCNKTAVELDGCDGCHFVVELVASNVADISDRLRAVCEDTSVEDACERFVDTFIEYFTKRDSAQICHQANPRPKTAPQPILGADMCTRGPAYWCASLDNAKECGTLSFCKEKYWV